MEKMKLKRPQDPADITLEGRIRKRIEKISEIERYSVDDMGHLYILQVTLDQLYKDSGKPKDVIVDFDKLNTQREELNAEDKAYFNNFLNIFELTQEAVKLRPAVFQQFFNGFHWYIGAIRDCKDANNLRYILADKLPLILTPQRYDAYKGFLRDEKRETKESFKSILENILYYCTTVTPDKTPPEIKKELDALEQQPADNEAVKKSYLSYLGKHYFQLAGTSMYSTDYDSLEEWDNAVKRYFLKNHLTGFSDYIEHDIEKLENRIKKLYFEGLPAIKEKVKELTGEEPTTKEAKLLYKDLQKVEAQKLVLGADRRAVEVKGVTVHDLIQWKTPVIYQHPVAGQKVSKLDLIKAFNISYGANSSAGTERETFKMFKKDCSGLYNALREYMNENIPQLQGLRANQHFNDVITWGELYDLKFIGAERYDYNDIEESEIIETHTRITGEPKTLTCGLAKTDREATNDPTNLQQSIASAFNSLKTVNIDDLENPKFIGFYNHYVIEVACSSLSYLYAYNTAIDIIGEQFNLPELEGFKFSEEIINGEIEGFNNLLFDVYYYAFGSDDDKEIIRKAIKNAFNPVYPEDFKPAPEDVEKLKEEISQDGLVDYDQFTYYINRLKRISKKWTEKTVK